MTTNDTRITNISSKDIGDDEDYQYHKGIKATMVA